jgi:hypothetical protein
MFASPDEVARILSRKVNVFAMVDAIEHFPELHRTKLFQLMAALAGQDTRIVLTFPTTALQQLGRAQHPEQMQIIDNDVHLDTLFQEARSAGFSIVRYDERSIWRPFDYAHCVLVRSDDRARMVAVPMEPKLSERIEQLATQVRGYNRLKDLLVLRRRRRRYVQNLDGLQN